MAFSDFPACTKTSTSPPDGTSVQPFDARALFTPFLTRSTRSGSFISTFYQEANVAEEAGTSADAHTPIPSRAQTPHHAQKYRMASLRPPVDKLHAVKSHDSVRRSQPKITILSLRDRINERGWNAVFVSPHRMRVFGERLVGIRGKQDPTRNRPKAADQTGGQKRSRVTRLSILRLKRGD